MNEFLFQLIRKLFSTRGFLKTLCKICVWNIFFLFQMINRSMRSMTVWRQDWIQNQIFYYTITFPEAIFWGSEDSPFVWHCFLRTNSCQLLSTEDKKRNTVVPSLSNILSCINCIYSKFLHIIVLLQIRWDSKNLRLLATAPRIIIYEQRNNENCLLQCLAVSMWKLPTSKVQNNHVFVCIEAYYRLAKIWLICKHLSE